MNRKLTAILISAGLIMPSYSSLAEPIDKTNTLPDAGPGQCYAKVMVPARYETKQDKVLVREAAQKIETIPARYKTVAKRAKVSNESLEWRQVLCETNMTKDIAKRVQQALKDQGYNVGAIDGIPGGATLRAVADYQKKKGLPTGGLTIRTLESLGVGI